MKECNNLGQELLNKFGTFKSLESAKAANLTQEQYFAYVIACEDEIRENMRECLPARDWALGEAVEFVDKLID